MAKAKKPAAKAAPAETAQEERPAKTIIEPRIVKVTGREAGPKPLKKGDEYLFLKNGVEVYMTKAVALVQLIRDPGAIRIPKGSEFVPPEGSKCDGC